LTQKEVGVMADVFPENMR